MQLKESGLLQAPLEAGELIPHLLRQPVSEAVEMLPDLRQLLLDQLGVDGQELGEVLIGELEARRC